MKLNELIKVLELYDEELQVVVQGQPIIMVDIGSFDKKTVVHIFSVDNKKLRHIHKKMLNAIRTHEKRLSKSPRNPALKSET